MQELAEEGVGAAKWLSIRILPLEDLGGHHQGCCHDNPSDSDQSERGVRIAKGLQLLDDRLDNLRVSGQVAREASVRTRRVRPQPYRALHLFIGDEHRSGRSSLQ